MAKKTSPGGKTVRKSAGKSTLKRKKTRLPGDTIRQGKVQRALYEIADAASAVTDMRSFYRKLHKIVGKLMYARSFYVTLYDAATGMLSSPYFADEAGDAPPPPTRIDATNKSLRAFVLLKGKTLHISGTEIEAGRLRGRFKPMGTPAEDWIGVPLKTGGQVIGSLTVQSYQKGLHYKEQDVQLLEFVAQHIAVALTRARAIDETRQRNAELAIINSVQHGLASKLEMQAIYDLVGNKIQKIFPNAQTVQLTTFDLDKDLMIRHYVVEKGERLLIPPRAILKVWKPFIARGQTWVINNDLANQIHAIDPAFKPPAGEVPKSMVAVPLMREGEINGVINLQNIDNENVFSDSDVRLLETLANSMSIALENARLWEQEKLYRKALERELEIGREIQAGFLPEALPLVEGWEIAATLISAREVAGDFYDAFKLPDGTIGLVIADVCDKGVGAALFMTLFRSLIRAIANLEHFEHLEGPILSQSTTKRLKRAMSLTNNYIAETHGESGMFATLFFGILDPRDGRLVYINGGHEPPLILQSGTVREILRKTGPALGAITDCHFDPVDTRLQAGEMLFAFTDGVPDCRNPHGDFYGRKQLLDVLQRASNSSHELVNAIEADLHRYIAGETQFDDITLLAVRRVH